MFDLTARSSRIWLIAVVALLLAGACGGSPAGAPAGAQDDNPPAVQPQNPPADNGGGEEIPVDETPADPAPPEDTAPPAGQTPPGDPAPPAQPAGDTPVAIAEIAPLAAFGGYAKPAVKLPASYDNALLELPIDLGGVSYLDRYPISAEARTRLAANGFVVVPGNYDEFYPLYSATSDNYEEERPVFVTADCVLHSYHLLFDKLLRDLEDKQLYPLAVSLTDSLAAKAEAQFSECKGTALEEHARRAWAYFAVAQQLLAPTRSAPPGAVAGLASAELALIDGHAGLAASPLATFAEPYLEDYSQYIPRGHYSRTEQRGRYFKALMWYGRINFRLKSEDETLVALLLTRLLHAGEVAGEPAWQAWLKLYDPTAFLVGEADDLGLREYSGVMREVYGTPVPLAKLADRHLLALFIEHARGERAPGILSLPVMEEPVTEQTQGFRFMGQRFVLDGYVYTQLMHPKVAMRNMPKALDFWAALGNPEARAILAGEGELSLANYAPQLDKVAAELAALPEEQWHRTVYAGWLDVLNATTAPKAGQFPPFMRTQAWARKDLHSALGSYAELKHDTILYAKQPMAAGAAPPLEAPPVQHWVEPVPEVYSRLAGLTAMTADGMLRRGLLTESMEQRLTSLGVKLGFLQGIAEKELAGGLLTKEESDELKYFGSWLEGIVISSADTPDGEGWGYQASREPAAIVADIATDAQAGKVLELGTGKVFDIFVVTPNGSGSLQLAHGGTYSYYEFPWPMGDRLTDEKWREMVAAGGQPARPDWTASFIAR